jgi:hypothetical protein
VVEHQLPKLSVVGSIPIARSNLAASQLRLASQPEPSGFAPSCGGILYPGRFAADFSL